MRSQKFNLIALLSIAVMITVAASKTQTFTGEVSDSMCGAKHMMENKAECTRACVSKGSSYALVVGDKVYTLHTSDKSALDQLNTLAGEQAKVTGTADGDTIEVSKVTPAK
jgi:endonuclease YncB( thermonuclease family)